MSAPPPKLPPEVVAYYNDPANARRPALSAEAPDPIATILATECPDGHNAVGFSCISQFSRIGGYFCAARIRAALRGKP